MLKPISGSCLCGQIRFAIDGKIGPVGQCHCSKCRKVSGTDGNAVFYTAAANFRWLMGQDEIRTYRIPGGGGWQSSFCATCGSPMPHTGGEGKIYFVPAGLLDDDPGFRGYAAHIFVGSKAPWVCISDTAPQYDEGFDSMRLDH
ncbi:MAG: GFA family protein [Novosphingobium sp.]|nr:GFA family protein [Novosphingobium sp.]